MKGGNEMTYIETLGSNAVKVKKILAVADTGKKNAALAEISRALIENSDKIIEANQKDLAAARNLNPAGPKHILLSHKYDSIFITYFESFS